MATVKFLKRWKRLYDLTNRNTNQSYGLWLMTSRFSLSVTYTLFGQVTLCFVLG